MTCVWKAVSCCLTAADLLRVFNVSQKGPIRPVKLLRLLKKHNRRTDQVHYQGRCLSVQQLEENYRWIKEIGNVNDGYYCSTCDPLFLLLAELFECHIIHRYQELEVHYEYQGLARSTWTLSSDSKHLTFLSKTYG